MSAVRQPERARCKNPKGSLQRDGSHPVNGAPAREELGLVGVGGVFRCIVADPPWPLSMSGQRKRSKERSRPTALAYPTMTVEEICALPVSTHASEDCHLWLWTTNQHLRDGFRVLESWGFRYLAPIHWIKPSGMGCWFVHRTQTLLFGYRERCRFDGARNRPNIFTSGDPVRHSQKPEAAFELFEAVSAAPRLELFARQNREGWTAWGNEIRSGRRGCGGRRKR